MKALADTFSRLLPGEMDAIVDHCIASGMSLDDVGNLRRSYFRRRARTHCPAPETLIRSVFDLYNVFKDLKDPERNGASFFIPQAQALKLLKKQCKYIQLGLLSDPPGPSDNAVTPPPYRQSARGY